MSGSNPFRRSQNVGEARSAADPSSDTHHSERTTAGRRLPSLNIEAPPITQRPSSKKTVRIASPPAATPISPQSFPSEPSSPLFTRGPEQTDASNLPEGAVLRGIALPDNDPFAAEASEGDDLTLGETSQNTRRNSTITDNGQRPQQEDKSDAVRRTLARFSAQPPRQAAATTAEGLSGSGTISAKSKQLLDVDAFTRLLLTGHSTNAAPQDTINAASTVAPLGQVSESSSNNSNTDTASLSRQSIFEPLPPVSSDTPRTSHENTPEDADDELRHLVRQDEKKKPPPPKTRHGKLIKSNPAVASPTSEVRSEPRNVGDDMTSAFRVSSNLNKPLPIAPTDNFSEGTSSNDGSPSVASRTTKKPPTPPTTRRQSHKDHRRSDQASEKLPLASPTESEVAVPPLASPSAVKAPPAPPARRQKRSDSVASSANQVALSETSVPPTPDSESFPEDAPGAEVQKSSPAPLARTMSISSTISAKRQSRLPGSTGGMAAPPPPPPRRGRGSSRGSIDSQRPSIQYLGDTGSLNYDSRRGSGDSSRNVSGSSHANDILADLAALQREVDQLRSKQRSES